MLEMLTQLCHALGIEKISQASSAEAAFDLLKRETFSLIISDYRLDGMSGVDFLEELRSRGDQTPVIMLSGAPDKQGVMRAVHHQRVDFFNKPFELSQFVGAIERLAA
jgi:DNA-binding NtrC family response regulator